MPFRYSHVQCPSKATPSDRFVAILERTAKDRFRPDSGPVIEWVLSTLCGRPIRSTQVIHEAQSGRPLTGPCQVGARSR
jgi:hypothetical protein